jgi:uncharacterized protein (DUF1778 family)
MNDQQLKLATDTIRKLIDALDDTVVDTNHISRLKNKKEIGEAAEVVLGGLLKQ